MSLKDIDKSNIPKHVAVIMDGNGRWAIKRGLKREKRVIVKEENLSEKSLNVVLNLE